MLKHNDKSDYINTVKGNQIYKNPTQHNGTAKNSTSLSTTLNLGNSKIQLCSG